MRNRYLAVLALVLPLWTAAASAEGLQLKPTVGGEVLACADFRGKSVRTNLTTELGDVARANYINGMPIIFLDEGRLATLPPKLQIFFYEHECAHMVLGHYFYRTTEVENEADCWSIQAMRATGNLTRQEVEEFAPYFANSKGSPFGHLPGPERARRLLSCFDGEVTVRAEIER